MANTRAETVRNLAKVVEIEHIYMTRFEAERLVIEQAPRECSVETTVSAESRVTSPSTFEASVTFQLTAKGADGTPVLKIKCQPCLKYRVTGTTHLQPDAVKTFAEVNAVFHAWPYCRELVQSATTRLGLTLTLTLPPLRVGDLLAGKRQGGDDEGKERHSVGE